MARTDFDDDRVIIERRSGSTMTALLAGIAVETAIGADTVADAQALRADIAAMLRRALAG